MAPITIPRRACRLAGAAVAAALLAPATAAAAEPFVMAGPVKAAGGYELRLVGFGNMLAVSFDRTAGDARQAHGFSFAENVKVTPTSIKGDLGRYGAVSLKLKGGKRGPGTVPPGCTGDPGTTKKGTFNGSLRFVGPAPMGTVSTKRLPAEISTTGTVDCDAADAADAAERKLMLMLQNGATMTMFEARAGSQSVRVMDDPATTAPANVVHTIDANGRGLDVAPDLSTATVPAIGPFLTGTGSYQGFGLDIGSFGTLGGSLVATFDVIGDVALQGDASIQ